MNLLRLVRTTELARYLHASPRTLEKWRLAADGPPFFKVRGAVRYDLDDVARWLERKRRRSTSDEQCEDE